MKQKQFIYDGVIMRASACLEKFANENLNIWAIRKITAFLLLEKLI